MYKCTNFYAPTDEGGILWSDPDIAIDWPLPAPVLSDKDRSLPRLQDLRNADLSVTGIQV